jgi:hypothetical protein
VLIQDESWRTAIALERERRWHGSDAEAVASLGLAGL